MTTRRILLQRGRWQFFHDWMSTSGGMYTEGDSYLELSFYVSHYDGLSLTVDVLAPVLGDIRLLVQNKRSLEHNKSNPYMRRAASYMLKQVSWDRRPWMETVKRDLEIREKNRKEAERRGDILH